MARTQVKKLAFNRGLVSRLGVARADIRRLAFASEIHTNWMTRVLGSMMLRPGWGHLGSSRNDAQAFHLPFVFSISDKALVELTDQAMRVWISDAVVTRPAITSAISNGTFDSNLTDWDDADAAGASSVWVAGGYMGLTGTGNAYAIRRQDVTVPAASQNVEHALHIVVERGPVVLRVGSTSGDDDYINETEIATGVHSLAFTPTGATFWVEFKSRLQRQVLVDSCVLEAAGAMVVETPWVQADLRKVRYDQSGDVIFVGNNGYQQRRIERRATRSWSVVRYQSNDGPFRSPNLGTITITPSGLTGNITLTASAPIFRSTHGPSTNNDGALFRVTSNGQQVSASISGENQFTDAIRVIGVEAGRVFTITIDEDAAGAATFTLQRSLESEDGPWTDVLSRTADTTETHDDTLDNQIAWYRLGVKTGDYVNGTHAVSLDYTAGSIDGVVRITEFTSSTVVSAEVLTALGGTGATDDWAEGQWSDRRGFPTAGGFHEGRFTWAGRDAVQASISDAFDSFDPEFEGDAGAINRTIGSGPVDNINWVLSLQRLILGGEGAEHSIRSSSLDEPLTPTNFNLKQASTQGSAGVAAVKVDQTGQFVQRGGIRVYEIAFGEDGIDYNASHLSALAPDIGAPGIVRAVVQRQPDTRVHYQRSDGTVAMLIVDKVEQVICWIEIETAAGDSIEDAVILPGGVGDEEDHVYYSVARAIDGSTKRYLEKWAFEKQVGNLTLNRQADSYVTYSQAASTTISGLSHLVGRTVVVWDNGKCLRTSADEIATFVVNASGQITGLTNNGESYEATEGVVGLQYSAPWKSAKLVELIEQLGGSLDDEQLITGLGLILADVHAKGVKFGQSLTESEMDELPEISSDTGGTVDADTVHTDYTTGKLPFPGRWSKDARLCLLAKAPRPATVLAALAEVEHHG